MEIIKYKEEDLAIIKHGDISVPVNLQQLIDLLSDPDELKITLGRNREVEGEWEEVEDGGN